MSVRDEELESNPSELLRGDDCFHGFISKKEAECRLLASGQEGALLLRAEHASSSKQQYSLSWLSPASLSVMHYPITCVCGDYFLLGRPFSSLLDLIQNFIERSDLAVLPLRPPSPVEITNRQRMAILPFSAITDSDELSFCEGDLLTELQQVDEQWIWARLEKNAQSGLVAVQLTVPLNDQHIRAEQLPYFHEAAVEELARLLNASGRGSYLVRCALHHKNGFALMVNSGQRIEKFLLRRREDNGELELGGRSFPTIPDVIDRYSRREICEGTKLVKAVLRKRVCLNTAAASVPQLEHLRSHSSCPQPVNYSHAFRKNKEDKWKTCYVMLSDAFGPQLFVFDSEKRAKPKLVLDLCYCFVYEVDESVDERANCIHVTLNSFSPSTAHLSFHTQAELLTWFTSLRARCLGCRYSSSAFAVVPTSSAMLTRISTFININIVAYRGGGLRSECGYSACVLVNSVRLVRTTPVAPSAKSVSFDKHLLIEHLPPGACALQLQLSCHNLLKYRHPIIKDAIKRELSASFCLPDNGHEVCVSADDCTDGFLFKAARHRLVVLPEEQYSSLFGLLSTRSFSLCQWIASQLSVSNRKHFARLLIAVLLPDHALFFAFLDALLDAQLPTERKETLFRGESFCSCCVSTAVHMIGRDLVVDELVPLLQQLHDKAVSPVDSAAFIRQLTDLITRLPPLFAAVFAHVAQACRRRFPNAPHTPRRALSVFLILRFINPILTLWSCSGGPARQLAKTVQAAANQAASPDFKPNGTSEAVSSMAGLMDIFVVPPVVDDSKIANPFVGYSKSEHMAMLAFHVDRVLQQRPEQCPIAEAHTVLSLLKAHEQRFIGSLS